MALGLGLRLWIAGLAFGSSRNSHLFGRQSAIRNSSRWCADICATPRILRLEERFDAEPRRISQEAAKPRRLPALATLVAPGVVLNKDGSFQRTARFRGPDLDSATQADSSARRRGSTMRCGVLALAGRSSQAQRNPAQNYPSSAFPDPVSTLVDMERKAQFEEEGAHFESGYFLTLCSCRPRTTPPAPSWLYEGSRLAARRRRRLPD